MSKKVFLALNAPSQYHRGLAKCLYLKQYHPPPFFLDIKRDPVFHMLNSLVNPSLSVCFPNTKVHASSCRRKLWFLLFQENFSLLPCRASSPLRFLIQFLSWGSPHMAENLKLSLAAAPQAWPRRHMLTTKPNVHTQTRTQTLTDWSTTSQFLKVISPETQRKTVFSQCESSYCSCTCWWMAVTWVKQDGRWIGVCVFVFVRVHNWGDRVRNKEQPE